MSPERFEAMGVDVVVGGATEAELEAVGLLFEKLDRTFSRFRPDSELNRVNAAAAEFVAASPIFARVLALALDAALRTDGVRVAGPLVFRYPGTKLDLNCVVKGVAVDA